MIDSTLGLPTMQGKTALGASSPDKPALVYPDPLSMIMFSVAMFDIYLLFYLALLVYI